MFECHCQKPREGTSIDSSKIGIRLAPLLSSVQERLSARWTTEASPPLQYGHKYGITFLRAFNKCTSGNGSEEQALIDDHHAALQLAKEKSIVKAYTRGQIIMGHHI